MDIAKSLTEAVHDMLAQAQTFALPCLFIIVVTMATILAWDVLAACWRSLTGRKPPRGPRPMQIW